MGWHRQRLRAAGLIGTFVAVTALAIENRGVLTLNDFDNGEVHINKIEVKYRLHILIGEPCKWFSLRYTPGDDMTKINSIRLRARVLCGTRQDAYVTFSPVVSQPGKWGMDVSGSPNWDELFFSDSGAAVSAARAKSYFKDGFSLVELEVLEIEATRKDPLADKFNGKFFKTRKGVTTELERALPAVAPVLPGLEKWAPSWQGIAHQSSVVRPSVSKSLFSVEQRQWRMAGTSCSAYRIVYEQGPNDPRGGKRINTACSVVISLKWRWGGNVTGQAVGTPLRREFQMVPGDKIVFMGSCRGDHGSFVTVLHTPPVVKGGDPFAQRAGRDPFDRSGPENPMERADRVKKENRVKQGRNYERQKKIEEIREQRRLRNEFEEEVRKSGLSLGTGDVQITLTWNNRSDLDLYVKEPSGDVLSFGNRNSSNGGCLDHDDRNGYGPENVYWARGRSPKGTYKVSVKLFSGDDASYKVRILRRGRVQVYKGWLGDKGDVDVVAEFENDPSAVEITPEQLIRMENELLNGMERSEDPYATGGSKRNPFE